jgi:16S rRNA (adenine1518-N6/adenine1519-N6)-dimethyltransferase
MATKKQKKLGQVFLKDKEVIQKIIQAAKIESKDRILEIGPGKGILTHDLLKTGAEIIAVEKDQKLIKFLKDFFKDRQNLKIIHADIRDFLKANQFYTQYSILNTQYKVIGNIPYYLTSHLLRLLLENSIKPSLIVLMIQKEVAERVMAQPPKMNLLSASVRFYAKSEIICYVPRTAFHPEPKVDSAVIKIIPVNTKENINEEQAKIFFTVIGAGFKQPRKLLINNLSKNLNLEKEYLQKIFLQSNMPLNTRAQNLSIEEWISLSSLLMKNIV